MISLIITTKNEEKNIANLLASIKKQKHSDYEIVVVDNNSDDKTKEIARKYTNKVFNKGPERSVQRNFGVEKAVGKYIFILDADMTLSEDVLSDAVGKFSMDENMGALVVPEKSFGSGFWAKFKIFEREFYVGDDTIEAARIFRKDVFQRFGGYDKDITGPEDYELPLRMKKAKIKIDRINSYIFHNEGKFSPINSAKKKFYYASKAKMYLKNHPEMLLKQGTLLFRPIFFRKWKKLIFHPFLSFGMFFIKSLEMFAGCLGFLISKISR